MTTFAKELTQAWRSLRQRKTYFLTCAGTLTLVLGANAAIFAVVNATILRPMPFATSGEVVHLFVQPPGTTAVPDRNPLQQMEVPRLRERMRTLARLEGFYPLERTVTRGGEPGVAQTAAVTPGLFPMMAAPIALGRWFMPSEGEPGHYVAVITDRYWRDTLGSASVLGRSLIIDDEPHAIVGVLAPAFSAPFLDAQIFTPLVASAEPQPRSPPRTVVGLAELAPGASIAQARDELATMSRQLAQEFPRTHDGWRLGIESAREWQYGSMRAALLMLFAATAFVLLIACVNVANLTSAQAIARSGELSLRLALGASKGDVLRLHLAELLIVCASGLIPGVLLASAAVPALLAIDPTIARTLGPVTIDWRVQAFSAALAILTAIAASMLPAIRAMRRDTSTVIVPSGFRTTGSPGAVRVQRAMVSIEVALCLALLMAGAVLVQGLRALSERSPGYAYARVLTAQIRLPDAAYKTAALRAAVVQRMLAGVRGVPGVVSVATTQNAFVPGFSYQTLVTIKDRPTPDGQPHTVQFRRVSPDYFKTMQIRTLHGREFADEDVAERPQVAVVSRRFADKLLPGADPVGQILNRTAPNSPSLTIIGVVDDAFDVSVTQQPEATLYLPWAQNNNSGVPVAFVIRTAVDPASLLPAVRETLRKVDASLPVRRAQPLEVFVRESTAPERFRTMVLSIIAGLGLVLAAVGISGVTYRGVVNRTREFAVRLALGSQPAAMVRLVLFESMRDLAIGAVAGFAAGAVLCALLERSMENVGTVDAMTTGVSIGLIVVAGVGAALLPAMRIMRVHPAEVLRS
jgi:putative ABC transport system permease protein